MRFPRISLQEGIQHDLLLSQFDANRIAVPVIDQDETAIRRGPLIQQELSLCADLLIALEGQGVLDIAQRGKTDPAAELARRWLRCPGCGAAAAR